MNNTVSNQDLIKLDGHLYIVRDLVESKYKEGENEFDRSAGLLLSVNGANKPIEFELTKTKQ